MKPYHWLAVLALMAPVPGPSETLFDLWGEVVDCAGAMRWDVRLMEQAIELGTVEGNVATAMAEFLRWGPDGRFGVRPSWNRLEDALGRFGNELRVRGVLPLKSSPGYGECIQRPAPDEPVSPW